MAPEQSWSRRILVIDDSTDIHEDFRKILSPKPKSECLERQEEEIFGIFAPRFAPPQYQLDYATQGAEGVEKARAARTACAPYALAFVDIRMPPGLDGVETAAGLLEADPEIQIVLCTAYSDYAWDEICANLPCRDNLLILKKPFSREEVSQLALALTEKWVLARVASLKVEALEAEVRARTEALREAFEQLKQDVKERERIEKERTELASHVQHLQRLESIGELAGGVAHDFNNLLTPIMGYAEMSLATLPSESPSVEFIDQIKKAALHGKALTQQLLAFCRRQVMNMHIMTADELLTNSIDMVGRLVGEHYSVELELCEPAACVNVDPSQFHQVIVNLIVNARDAMPEGGKIHIRTAMRTLDRTFCKTHEGIQPGEYVEFVVSDTGCGMSDDELKRIFEPYFTTKSTGTGMGLATSYGIVSQHGGVLLASSEIGVGTSFSVLIPVAKTTPSETIETGTDVITSLDHLTVLVVEDDEQVRSCIARSLKMHSFDVLEAPTASDAISVFQNNLHTIDVVLSDLVMPKMSGVELCRKLAELRPGLATIYMSGYPRDYLGFEQDRNKYEHFISKPFSTSELIDKLKQAAGKKSAASMPV